jgi:tetratricopeptide (TPR) repeat protein
MMMENYVEAEKYFLPNKYNLDKDNLLCSNKCLAYIYSHTNKKEYEKIMEMYTNALNFNDQDIDCYLELAILNELRKPEDSIKLYEKAIELIRKIDFQKYNFLQTRSLYDVKEIFPEILNNYATIKLRLHHLDNVDKILNEALVIIKKRQSSLAKNQEGKHIIPEGTQEQVMMIFILA